MSDPINTNSERDAGSTSSDLFSRVCRWLNQQADEEMEIAKRMAQFESYHEAAECKRTARIYRLVKSVIEEKYADILSENAKAES